MNLGVGKGKLAQDLEFVWGPSQWGSRGVPGIEVERRRLSTFGRGSSAGFEAHTGTPVAPAPFAYHQSKLSSTAILVEFLKPKK